MAFLQREVLKGFLSGESNRKIDYIAGEILKPVAGPAVGLVATYDGLAALDDGDDGRVDQCSASTAIKKTAASSINYATAGYAKHDVVCYDAEEMNQAALSDAQRAVEELEGFLLAGREQRLDTLIRNATWATGSGAMAAGDRWNSTGDIFEQFEEANEVVTGGITDVIMGPTSKRLMLANTKFQSALSNDSFKWLSSPEARKVFFDLFGVRLWVSTAKTSAGFMLMADDVFWCRLDSGSQGQEGLNVRPTALLRVESTPLDLYTEEIMNVGVKGGQMVKASMKEVMLQVTGNLGFLKTAVGG